MSLKIVEGIVGVWRYHLSETGEPCKPALCGNTRVMQTKIPLANWNNTPKDWHVPESFCKECNEIYKIRKE